MQREPDQPPFILIGASAGGVRAMLELVARLPENFPAPLLFVQHIGAHRSQLASLLSGRGPNRASEARDGEIPTAGSIYVAPPDRHMLIDRGVLRLHHGPKEHHSRPAIDPLFRSGALDCGPRAIGVVLTGRLDDGSAGLRAIQACGGVSVVQDPADADEPSMPRCAIAAVKPDHVVPLSAMPDLFLQLARERAQPFAPFEVPESLRREHAVAMGEHAVENLKTIAKPSVFSCPDCGGVLFELDDPQPVRYRCHTGHAFSIRSLAATQEEVTDAALWSSLRALQEKEGMLRRLARMQGMDAPAVIQARLREADEIAAVSAAMRKLMIGAPASADFDVG
jgi:two-component system chemotaxis response regulator CheB